MDGGTGSVVEYGHHSPANGVFVCNKDYKATTVISVLYYSQLGDTLFVCKIHYAVQFYTMLLYYYYILKYTGSFIPSNSLLKFLVELVIYKGFALNVVA